MIRRRIAFSFMGAFITISFLVLTNYLTTPNYYWSISPIFAILYWPITVYYLSQKKYRTFSIVGALVLIVYLVTNNYLTSPDHPWCLYAIFPILWWPIIQHANRRAKTLSFSIASSISLILYYIALNYYISPGYPWSIYTTFTFLWWPILMYFIRKRKPLRLSIVGVVLLSIFFIIVNYISTPNVVWAIYPIFAALWWPLVTYYFVNLK